MKTHRIAAFAAVAVGFYLLGLWTAPALHSQSPETKASAKPTRSNQSRASLDGGPGTSPLDGLRSNVSAHSDHDRISISRQSIRNLLEGKTYGHPRCFDGLEMIVGDALTLLGATEQEIHSAVRIFQASAEALKQQEKELAKISRPYPSTIVIDLTAVHAPVRKSIEEMQANLRAKLPAGMAEVLISSIPWESYYLPEGVGTVIFAIRQSSAGYVSGNIRSDHFSQTINTAIEPPDGSPVEASRIFRAWDHLLDDTTIVPQPIE